MAMGPWYNGDDVRAGATVRCPSEMGPKQCTTILATLVRRLLEREKVLVEALSEIVEVEGEWATTVKIAKKALCDKPCYERNLANGIKHLEGCAAISALNSGEKK